MVIICALVHELDLHFEVDLLFILCLILYGSYYDQLHHVINIENIDQLFHIPNIG